ncbi:ABC transporter permease [Paenibacillus sepulcri]|uniref:FtsX-like permease family protein n=1 Tax=Paenibacillus sepulcri TaxID=359917 RepID=A0ABS7C0F1_9BACL|nr:FtsX-like permease family protein [Paenibacillus sepulcri]
MTFRQFAYRNVMRNKRTYAAYFLSSSFSVMIFCICALFIFNPGIQEGMIFNAAIQALVAAEGIMYVFSFFFVLYSVSSFLKMRKREFGLLMMHGMTKGQLNRMIFFENMLIGLGAIAAGIAAGLLTGKLFLMIGSKFVGLSSLPFYLSGKALALTALSFIVLFLLISLCTAVLIRTNKLIELFQSGQKPKAQPKSSVLLSLLAVVLLTASYYLSVSASVSTVILRMIPVIVMTITGTYFFYTQLSVYTIKLLQRKRSFFLRKTNIITVSSLAYRVKDNARMFFMVTIISTVSFCSVGAFTSLQTLTSQFADDYPAAIGYVAKDGSGLEEGHLQQIRDELAYKAIPYESYRMPVKYVAVQTHSAADSAQERELHLISFSDYKEVTKLAGVPTTEQALSGDEALVLMSSLRDKAYIQIRELLTYTLQDSGIGLRETGYTKRVAIPDYLMTDLDDDRDLAELEEDIDTEFSGMVVSDELFNQITAPVQTDYYTGFYVKDIEQTIGMLEELADFGVMRYDMGQPYAITVSGTLQAAQNSLYSIMLFVALLVGTVFFIAAGSFLYFRLYADLDYDRRQFLTMVKIGLTEKELSRMVTRQLALLFFVPILFAVVHSIFAFIALQKFFFLSIANQMGVVLISFFMAQILYFFFIRNRYLRNLKKTLV